MDTKILTDYGVDYDTGLRNCMNNAALYKKILSMFLVDPCFSSAKAAIAARDQKDLFNRMHELKGISGNAALAELYSATVPFVELLRNADAPDSEIARLFPVVEKSYLRACEGIKLFLAE